MRTPRLLLAALAGAAVLLAAPAAVAEDQAVKSVQGDVFSPKLVAVKPGNKVTFTNDDTSGGEHNVVWNDGKVPPQPPDSVVASQWPAGGVTRTFTKAGRYRYFCALHGDSTEDFGMYGYVYVNAAGVLPPVVSGLTASATRTKVTLKFRSSGAGKAKARFFRKSGRKFVAAGSATFAVKSGKTTKPVTKALSKGSWRVDLVVTDSNRVASDKRTKTFTVR
jgi:plastocyanin